MSLDKTWLVIPVGGRQEYLEGIVRNAGIPPDRIIIVQTQGGWSSGLVGVRVICDYGELNIQRWWNTGIQQAKYSGAKYVAVFNDDLIITPDIIPAMVDRLDETGATICYVGYTEGQPHPTMTGWAWMLNVEHEVFPDQRFRWWFGDDDMYQQATRYGHGVTTIDKTVVHLHPNGTTAGDPIKERIIQTDRLLFTDKWGIHA